MRTTPGDMNVPDAWVVFSGQCEEMPWLRVLRPGFRHCYALLNDGRHWICFEPLSNYTDIQVQNLPAVFDLPLWLKDHGHTVVKARVVRSRKEAPWMPHTCVEAVKRVIGLHARSIITPWQLYKHLSKSSPYEGELTWQAQ
ncbi:MAG: hypothetical protein WBK55_05270 [Alphaproteobacteria bacterium]